MVFFDKAVPFKGSPDDLSFKIMSRSMSDPTLSENVSKVKWVGSEPSLKFSVDLTK